MEEFIYESIVFCSACTMPSVRKFTFAISSPDEFLVYIFNSCAVLQKKTDNTVSKKRAKMFLSYLLKKLGQLRKNRHVVS